MNQRVTGQANELGWGDTSSPLLVWEVPYYPTYYFPRKDVTSDSPMATGEVRLVAFYNEKVDIDLDEVLQQRPKSKFSSPS